MCENFNVIKTEVLVTYFYSYRNSVDHALKNVYLCEGV